MGAGPVNQPASSKSSARHAVVGEDASLNPLKYFQIEWSGMSVWLCWVGLPATDARQLARVRGRQSHPTEPDAHPGPLDLEIFQRVERSVFANHRVASAGL